jgi:hypothetical protein
MGNLQPAICQEQINILQPAATLVKVAADAPQRIEIEAIALRLNTMANDGETEWTPKKSLNPTTIDELKNQGYIVIPKANGLVEIRLPQSQTQEVNP